MSAFQVSPAHIGAIVRFALTTDKRTHYLRWKDRAADMNDAEDMMSVLALECYRSVSYRYPDGELPGPNAYPDSPVICDPRLSIYRELTPIETIKACHCLAYQSCEHPDWDASAAKQLLDRIEALAVRQMPGYDAADWDICETGAEYATRKRAELNALGLAR